MLVFRFRSSIPQGTRDNRTKLLSHSIIDLEIRIVTITSDVDTVEMCNLSSRRESEKNGGGGLILI